MKKEEILQPMGAFTPIAMKCTQEQFEAIKPKLEKLKSLSIFMFNKEWNTFYLELFKDGGITNGLYCSDNIEVHETWNEEIFLKACGIEVESSLTEQLQKAEAEVKRLQDLIEEENKLKVGDWVISKDKIHIYKVTKKGLEVKEKWDRPYDKITNPELIKLLDNEHSTKN